MNYRELCGRFLKNCVFPKEYIDKLRYAFRYWDINQEAMMMISESLYAGIYSTSKPTD